MKYVILRKKGIPLPVIFPDMITHSSIGELGAKATSAGFFQIDDDGRVITFGTSESLRLAPAAGDAALIGLLLDGREALLPFNAQPAAETDGSTLATDD